MAEVAPSNFDRQRTINELYLFQKSLILFSLSGFAFRGTKGGAIGSHGLALGKPFFIFWRCPGDQGETPIWSGTDLGGFTTLTTSLIGFLIIYVFYMTYRVRVAPIYVAFIMFALAVSVGTVWEIFEFLMDWFFGLNLQQSGLVDTMTDLIINSIGALIAAAIGYDYAQDGDSLLGRRLIRKLVERNRLKTNSTRSA